jgi:hypothetical protein
MKYIIGASVGGLFGIGMPIMMEIQKVNNDEEVPRQEEFQPIERDFHIPIDNMLLLPDNYCGSLDYESTEPLEQARECLEQSLAGIPAI